MRSVALVATLLLVGAAACSAAPSDEASGSSDLTGSKTSNQSGKGGCATSRATILASASPARQRAIQRGFKWLDDDVPYSQSASHEGYRTDCSGFVSMCWELGESSNTSAFYAGGDNKALGSWSDLIPADAVVKKGHIMLFLAFDDDAQTNICVLEQASTKSDMQFRTHPVSSLKSEGYKPIRATKLANDTGGGSGTAPTAGDDDDDSSIPLPTTTTPRTPPSAPPDSTCVPPDSATACAQAFTDSGFECGILNDGCGGTVNCDRVPTFGCAANETCGPLHTCTTTGTTTPPTCTPISAAQACAAAKVTTGLQCGVVSDGCGGSVSCNTVPSFGCATGQTCGPDNKCAGAAPPPAAAPAAPSNPAAPDPAAVSPTPGDPGDGDDDDSSAKTKPAPTPAKPSAKGGCSAAPQGQTRSDALPFLALAAGAMLRRKKRAAGR